MNNQNFDVHGAAAVGPGAHAHDVTVNSNHLEISGEIDMSELASQLERLRQAMHSKVGEPEHYLALSEISLAEKAASKNDRSGVAAHLAKAGKWALDVATEIGTKVAVAAINQAGGLQ